MTTMSEAIKASAPAPESVMKELFEFLAIKLNPEVTYRPALGLDTILNAEDRYLGYHYIREFSRAHGLDEDELTSWLDDMGAYSDGTALENVAVWYIPSSYDPVIDPHDYPDDDDFDDDLDDDDDPDPDPKPDSDPKTR